MYKENDLVRVLYGEDKGRVYVVKGIGCNILGEDIYLHSNGMGKKLDQLEPVTHLTTKEFIRLVEDMGYRVKDFYCRFLVMFDYKTVAEIAKNMLNRVDTNIGNYEVDDELFKVIILYANTPLELREEKEQLYTLELPNTGNEYRYYAKGKTEYMFDNIDSITGYQKIFEQKEIDELPNQELIKTLVKKEVEENENE